MRILMIADPIIPVPPEGYGGTERIIDLLATELQRRGHVVDLIAKEGSHSYGGRLRHHRAPDSRLADRAYRKLLFQAVSTWAGRDADLVHTFGRPDYLWSHFHRQTPIVIHFQNPVDQLSIRNILCARRSKLNFIGVSQSQIDGITPTDYFTVVHNATPLTSSSSDSQANPQYLAFLGRLTPEKGVDTAIEVALRTGLKLKIAGNVPARQPLAKTYFDDVIRPHLGQQIEWVGEISDREKPGFFRDALGLLFPIRWQEPCAIAVIEALACGVPVVASRMASTPEIVRDGETGFLCSSMDEMVGAVGKLGTIDREACRLDAQRRFSPGALTDQVLRVYEKTV